MSRSYRKNPGETCKDHFGFRGAKFARREWNKFEVSQLSGRMSRPLTYDELYDDFIDVVESHYKYIGMCRVIAALTPSEYYSADDIIHANNEVLDYECFGLPEYIEQLRPKPSGDSYFDEIIKQSQWDDDFLEEAIEQVERRTQHRSNHQRSLATSWADCLDVDIHKLPGVHLVRTRKDGLRRMYDGDRFAVALRACWRARCWNTTHRTSCPTEKEEPSPVSETKHTTPLGQYEAGSHRDRERRKRTKAASRAYRVFKRLREEWAYTETRGLFRRLYVASRMIVDDSSCGRLPKAFRPRDRYIHVSSIGSHILRAPEARTARGKLLDFKKLTRDYLDGKLCESWLERHRLEVIHFGVALPVLFVEVLLYRLRGGEWICRNGHVTRGDVLKCHICGCGSRLI